MVIEMRDSFNDQAFCMQNGSKMTSKMKKMKMTEMKCDEKGMK